MLARTDGADHPFWSPDSRFVGFFADGKLKKIAAEGGAAVTLCDAANGARGGSWGKRRLQRVACSGFRLPAEARLW
jgi:eukaryotic-like serine/threonine-protein kinase